VIERLPQDAAAAPVSHHEVIRVCI
jgi:hypothetical protein